MTAYIPIIPAKVPVPNTYRHCPECKRTSCYDDGSPCFECDGSGIVKAAEPDLTEWQYRHERGERSDYEEHSTYWGRP